MKLKSNISVFSHLRCEEQMWDCEGKEVDEFEIKKLLTRYDNFSKRRIGKDLFITLPGTQSHGGKARPRFFWKHWESAPRSYDTASLFYGDDNIPPIFEVILPMTNSTVINKSRVLLLNKWLCGWCKQHKKCFENDITIKEWIGEFKTRNLRGYPVIRGHSIHALCWHYGTKLPEG